MDKPTDKADRCIFRIQRTKMDKPTDKADRCIFRIQRTKMDKPTDKARQMHLSHSKDKKG